MRLPARSDGAGLRLQAAQSPLPIPVPAHVSTRGHYLPKTSDIAIDGSIERHILDLSIWLLLARIGRRMTLGQTAPAAYVVRRHDIDSTPIGRIVQEPGTWMLRVP